MSDQLDVSGIASALIFDLTKWTPNVARAASDAVAVGRTVEGSLARASTAGTASMAALASSVGGSLGKAATSGNASMASLASGVSTSADRVTVDLRKITAAAASVRIPPFPAPTNVVNWTAGLRSLAGVAGTVSPAMGQVVSGFTAVEGAAAAAGLKTAGMAAAMGPLAVAVAAVAAQLFLFKQAFDFGLGGIKLAADMEQTALAFEVMIGNAALATQTLGELEAFANATPFEFPEVADAAKKLLAMGIAAERLQPSLRMVGDVASGLGQPLGEMAYLFGQAFSKPKVDLEDLNQFAGRGVPIFNALAQVMGVSVGEVRAMVNAGKVGFPQIEAAFRAMTGEGGRFQGMMERQSGTLNGLMSTLADAWGKVQREVGKTLAADMEVKSAIAQTIALVAQSGPLIVDVFKGIAIATAPAVAALRDMLTAVNGVATSLEASGTDVPRLVGAMVTAMVPLINSLRAASYIVEKTIEGLRWLDERRELLADKAAAAVTSGVTAKEITDARHANEEQAERRARERRGQGVTDAGGAAAVAAALAPGSSPALPASPGQPGGPASPVPATVEDARVRFAREMAESIERARKADQDAHVQRLRNADKEQAAELAQLSYRTRDRFDNATSAAERAAVHRQYEADKAAIEKRYADAAAKERDAQRERDEQAARASAERKAEFETRATIDGLRAAGKVAEAARAELNARWARTLAGITDRAERLAAERGRDAELAAFDAEQAGRARRDAESDTRRAGTSDRDASPAGAAAATIGAADSPVTKRRPGESAADRRRRFNRGQSERTLAQLDLRESLHGLSGFDAGRRDRLRGMLDVSAVPDVGAAAGQLAARASTARRSPVEPDAGGTAAGGRHGGLPSFTVKAPGFDERKLAEAMAVAIKPEIERQVDKLRGQLAARDHARRAKADT